MSDPKRLLDLPEVTLAIFAFLLNFVWEFLQVPLFAGLPTASHWDAILVCGRATLGDVVIALASYWAVAMVAGRRRWILTPTGRTVAGFVAVGILITVVMEWLATQVLGRWAYGPMMPLIPLLGNVGRENAIAWAGPHGLVSAQVPLITVAGV